MNNSLKKIYDNIANLALDMDDDVNLNLLPIIYSLYVNILNFNPNDPSWYNRDRFIMGMPSASSLFYSTLLYSGYDYSIEDIKRFKELDSFTPGSPIYNPSLGIEATTGILGEEIGCAIGIALGQRYIENMSLKDPKNKVIDFNTYVLFSDKCLNDGLALENLLFASKQKLNKLVFICYCENDIDNSYLDMLNFNITEIRNGDSINTITSTLKETKRSKKPSLILVYNHRKSDLISEHEKYLIDESSKNLLSDIIQKRISKKYNISEDLKKSSKEQIDLLNGELSINFNADNYAINDGYCESGITSTNKVLNFISTKNKYMLCGIKNENSKIRIQKSELNNFSNPLGRNVNFFDNVRCMASVMNGISLLNIKTFMVMSLWEVEMIKTSIKLASLMKLGVNYILIDDKASSKESDILYQPGYEIQTLRMIPSLNVFRPCDINEIMGTFDYSIKNNGPSAFSICDDDLPKLVHTNPEYIQYGGYIVLKEKKRLDGVIIATGSEVKTALKIAVSLNEDGFDLRVVSMPSLELYLKQNPIYGEKLLPKSTKIITIEASNTYLWNKISSYQIGIDSFGICGNKKDILSFLEFDEDAIYRKIKKIIESD